MPKLYHYEDSGLPNIWLDGGVEVTETPYGPATSIANLDNLHHEIAMDIIGTLGPVTGAEFRFLRIELDLSQRVLAQCIKSTEKNVQRWESARDKDVPGPAGFAIGALYVAKKSDEKFRELMDAVSELDTEITELQHREFRLTDNHWEAA